LLGPIMMMSAILSLLASSFFSFLPLQYLDQMLRNPLDLFVIGWPAELHVNGISIETESVVSGFTACRTTPRPIEFEAYSDSLSKITKRKRKNSPHHTGVRRLQAFNRSSPLRHSSADTDQRVGQVALQQREYGGAPKHQPGTVSKCSWERGKSKLPHKYRRERGG
jgi:hypothetical protein